MLKTYHDLVTIPECHDLVVDGLVEGELLADEVLDPLVQLDVVLRHEGDGLPGTTRPRRPTHAVDVVLEGCNSIDMPCWTALTRVLTRVLTFALSDAFLNLSLTPVLSCALTEALNSKCLLHFPRR